MKGWIATLVLTLFVVLGHVHSEDTTTIQATLPSTKPHATAKTTATTTTFTSTATTPTTAPNSTPPPAPTTAPSTTPNVTPITTPKTMPTTTASVMSTTSPNNAPTTASIIMPTTLPATSPNTTLTTAPTTMPGTAPNTTPTTTASTTPSNSPITTPATAPTTVPTTTPTTAPTTTPTPAQTTAPSTTPNVTPITTPKTMPITTASITSTTAPNTASTITPTTMPATSPNTTLTTAPTTMPTPARTTAPSSTPNNSSTTASNTMPTTASPVMPTTMPATAPNTAPTTVPNTTPATTASTTPSTSPITTPATAPTTAPSTMPTTAPTTTPTPTPTTEQTTVPATMPSTTPTTAPSTATPTPPDPQAVDITSRTRSDLTLNVTLPTDCDGCEFVIVKYSPTGDTTKNSSTKTCKPQSCTIEGLNAGTCYNFTVYTRGRGGNSTTGTTKTGCTLPSTPKKVDIGNQTTNSVTMTVTQDCGKYDGFLVLYNNLNQSFINLTSYDSSSGGRHDLIVDNGLSPGTTYVFHVYTLSNGSRSVNSSNITGSTVPNPPEYITVSNQTTSSVTLAITSPSSGSVDYYNVMFTDADGQNKILRTPSNDTSYSADNLTAGNRYIFSVVSVYQNLTSSPYLSVSTSTVPNPPEYITLSNQTTSSITLAITSPSSGSVDYYNVMFTDADGQNKILRTPSNDTSYSADNLTAGNRYIFSVVSVYQNLTSSPCLNVSTSTVPNRPIAVAVTNRTTTSVTLTVTPGNGGHDGYRVKDVNDDIYPNTNFTCFGNLSTVLLTGLTPGRTFTFNVYTLANGLESKDYYGFQDATKPQAPESVKITNQSNTSVTLTVTTGDTGHDGFLVLYGGYNMTFPLDGNSNTSYGLTVNEGLIPGTIYTFHVFTLYSNLTSDNSTNTNGSTVPAAPEMSGYSTTDNTVTVSLTSNGGVGEYLASQHCVSSDDISPSVSKTTTAVTISGLSPGTTCDLTVVAVFAGLNSSVAYFPSLSINESTPGPVGNLSAQTLSSKAIRVTWNKPSDPNGDIIQYCVYVTDDEGRCVQLVHLCTAQCTATQQSETCNIIRNETFPQNQTDLVEIINGLLAYKRYNFTVHAYTKVGRGVASSVTNCTSESEPHIITELKIENTTSTTITISFHEPEPSTGPITQYEVRYTYKERICKNGLNYGNDTSHYTTCTPSSGRSVCSIHKLYPYWNYSISVRAYTSVGPGNWSHPLLQRTGEDKPNVIDVNSVKSTLVTAHSVTLKWSAPCPPNGVIRNYVILWNTSSPINTTNNSVSYTVPSLYPYRNYTYQVAAVTGAGEGEYTSVKTVTTLVAGPHQPSDVRASTINSTRITVMWNKPDRKTGPTNYTATAIDEKTPNTTSSCTTKGFESTTCMIGNLDEYWNYTIVVIATTVNGYAYSSNNKTIRTAQAAPGPVTIKDVSIEPDVTKARTVNVTCNPPVERDLNGVITGYTLEWGYSKGRQHNRTSPTCSWRHIPVSPEQNYTFTVFASTNVGKGTESLTHKDIPPGAPLINPSSQTMIKLESSSAVSDPEKQFRVDFDQTFVCDERNGHIINHYVFVSEADNTGHAGKPFQGTEKNFENRLRIYRTWSAIKDADSITPYVASRSWQPCPKGQGSRRRRRAPSPQTVTFTVGEGGDCSGDCNGYVQPGRFYKVRVAFCTKGGCSESEWSNPIKTDPNLTPSIAGGVVGALLAVAIFLAVMFILRRRSMLCFNQDTDNGFTELSGKTNVGYRGDSTEMTVMKARNIKVTEFADKFYQLSKDSNMKFSEEVKLLKELSPSHPTNCAEEQAVRIKNRYTNILAYDHSRVKLLPLDEEEGSDYINANYIPGYHSKREYIATQGPLVCTKDDFWRMIWEQNVSVIVMLTQLVERGRRKCDQYWPEEVSEPVYFGDLIVRIDSESTLPDYVIRVISMQLNTKKKKMKQVHYLKWPDMGCPDTTWLLLNFVQDVRLFMPHQNPGPIVVHCSAGVGRTGTFIAVDHLIQRLNAGKHEVDIFNMVLGMRNERPNMVQTEDQYIFIHECIKDFLTSGDEEDEEGDEEEDEEEDEPIYQNT